MDRDLETFRLVWQGESVGGGLNPAVPAGTRQIPMLFGGFTPSTMERMARWGEGYIGLGLAAPLVEPSFEAARAAWTQARREGAAARQDPVLRAGRSRRASGQHRPLLRLDRRRERGHGRGSGLRVGGRVKAFVDSFAAIGVDEIIFNPATDDDDVDEVGRIAEIVF